MCKVLKDELRKIVNLKNLLLFLMFLIVCSFVLLVSMYYSIENNKKSGLFIIRLLVLNGNFYIPIIISIFAVRIFSIEYENNMQNFLRIHNKFNNSFFMFKMLISISYILISYFIIFIIAYIFELFVETQSCDLVFKVIGNKIVFKHNFIVINILKLYLNQFLGSLFILEILLFILTKTEKYMISLILMPCCIFFVDIVGYIAFKYFYSLREYFLFLPLNPEYIWRNLGLLGSNRISIGLALFSIILIIINFFIMKSSFER